MNKLKRIIQIAAFLVVIVTFVTAQSKSPESRVKLTFDLPDKPLCLGDQVTFEAKLTNFGEKPVVIDIYRLADTFVFDKVGVAGKIDRYNSFAMQRGLPAHYRPKLQMLRPKESYSGKVELDLEKRLFVSTGNYNLKIGYSQRLDRNSEGYKVWIGSVWSSGIAVLINNCGKS